MSKPNKSKMIVQVFEQFPRRRSDAATHQFTLEQVQKYLSPKRLRRAPPRKHEPARPPVDGQPENAADQ